MAIDKKSNNRQINGSSSEPPGADRFDIPNDFHVYQADKSYRLAFFKKGKKILASIVSSKTKSMSIGVIIVVICAISLWAFLFNPSTDNNICTTNKNQTKLKDFTFAVEANNIALQQQITDEIKSLPNYQKDPNCLYAMTLYSINRGDITRSKNFLSELRKVYKPKVGYSPLLGSTQSITSLQASINAMVANNQSITSNTYLMGISGGIKKQ